MFFILICIASLITPVFSIEGLPPVDPQWEDCNDYMDVGFHQLGNCLNQTNGFSMQAVDPCPECIVHFLGTVKRTGDIPFVKNKDKPDCYDHSVKLGFATIRLECKCELKIPVFGTVSGGMNAIWTEPRISTNMLMCNKEKTVNIGNTKVLDDPGQSTDFECVGTSDVYLRGCEQAKGLGSFDVILKKSVEVLFPFQSTAAMEKDNKLLLELDCSQMGT